MRTRHLIGLLLAALLAAPATAGAAWNPSEDVATLGGGSGWAYDGNARGDRLLVWETQAGMWFAQALPGAALGAARPLGDPGPNGPGGGGRATWVELDERGNALLVWSYFDGTDPEYEIRGDGPCCWGLRARVIRRDGTTSAPKTLSPRGYTAYLGDMQIGPRGEIGVVFGLEQYTTYRQSRAGRFGTVGRGFGLRERVPAGDPGVALAFVKQRARILHGVDPKPSDSRSRFAFREAERRGRGRWRGLRAPLRSVFTGEYRLVRIATAPSGAQAATWLHSVAERGRRYQVVYAATRDPGRPFRARRLAREDGFFGAATAIEPRGGALAAWASRRRDTLVTARARARRAFGALTRFTPDPAEPPLARVNAGGTGLLVWAERVFAPDNPHGLPQLVGAFRSPDGSMLERHVIRPRSSEFGPVEFAVSLDRGGRGSVAYVTEGRLKLATARLGD